jgi:hypothetical protein
MHRLCSEFKEKIVEVEKYEFTVNIRSFLVTSMLLPFLVQYKIYTSENVPHHKIDILRYLHDNNVFSGTEIKQHELTSLTPYPEKSLELLNSCNDNKDYCIMSSKYLIIDYNKIIGQKLEYYCNSDDPDKIKRITNSQDLLGVEDGDYLYCILPDETLCLFGVDGHHSAGACGQPVICAGDITISDKKIKKIDNTSGHYSPPFSMLKTAIDVLKTKGLIESVGKEDQSRRICGEMRVFVF